MTSTIVAIGIGYTLGRVAASCLENMQLPGALTVLGAAAVLSGATVVASLLSTAGATHAWTRWRRSRRTVTPLP